jgi:serine/threonine protein phosphatase 1
MNDARPRTIAIGDIHGCSAALDELLEAIHPQPDDTIVTLGDYVDRGPDSRGVIDRLIRLQSQCRLVPLLGNHDQTMLDVLEGRGDVRGWLGIGGLATLDSYGYRGQPDAIPAEHIEFLRSCRLWHETETHFFVHACYRPNLPLEKQDQEVLLWQSIQHAFPGPHRSGKVAVLGHTPQPGPQFLYLGYLMCLDTSCCYGGWLTAVDVETGQAWRARNESQPALSRSHHAPRDENRTAAAKTRDSDLTEAVCPHAEHEDY